MEYNPFPVELFFSSLDFLHSPMIHLTLLTIFAVTIIAFMRTAPKNICLGVKIPADKYDAMPCRHMRGRFELGVVVLAVLAGGMIWQPATQLPKVNADALAFGCVQMFFLVCALIWYYYIIRRAMSKLVEREGWFPARESGKVVIDTSFHQRKKNLSLFWLLLFPLIIFATFWAYQSWRPEIYSGEFTGVFTELDYYGANLFSSFGVPMIIFWKNAAFYIQTMLAVWAILVFLAYANARQSLDPNDPTGSLEEELRRRKNLQALQLITYTACMIIFGLLPFVPCRNVSVTLFVLGLFPVSVATILFQIYFFSRTGKTATVKSDAEKREGWFFYRNEDDPALFLRSRTGMGVIMNIARPTAKIICAGFCLLTVGLLWYAIAHQPMTSPGGFFPMVDPATKDRTSHGATLFLEAAYHSGDMMTPQLLDSYRHPLSVKGKIELIKVTSHFPSEFKIWQRSNDFQGKLQDYIDNKITLEQFGEYYTVETVSEEKVVFGRINSITVDAELQKLRDQGRFDNKQHPAQTIDGEYIYHSELPLEWRKMYGDYQFETMGQLQGQAAGALVNRIVNGGMTAGEDYRIKNEFREAFLRDVAIAKYYNGKDLFAVTNRETYDGSHVAEVLENRTDRRMFPQQYHVLIDPSRGYASPYGMFRYSWGLEAWRASDYFKFGTYRWMPQNYTAFKFSRGSDFVATSAQIVRVTLAPETVEENRRYQETWNEETQTRAYEEVKNAE